MVLPGIGGDKRADPQRAALQDAGPGGRNLDPVARPSVSESIPGRFESRPVELLAHRQGNRLQRTLDRSWTSIELNPLSPRNPGSDAVAHHNIIDALLLGCPDLHRVGASCTALDGQPIQAPLINPVRLRLRCDAQLNRASWRHNQRTCLNERTRNLRGQRRHRWQLLNRDHSRNRRLIRTREPTVPRSIGNLDRVACGDGSTRIDVSATHPQSGARSTRHSQTVFEPSVGERGRPLSDDREHEAAPGLQGRGLVRKRRFVDDCRKEEFEWCRIGGLEDRTGKRGAARHYCIVGTNIALRQSANFQKRGLRTSDSISVLERDACSDQRFEIPLVGELVPGRLHL